MAAAVHGAAAWCAYGVVEYLLVGLWPLVTSPTAELTPWFWQGTTLLLVIYGLVGFLLAWPAGGILALAGSGASRLGIQAIGSATLGLAFAATLAIQPNVQRSDEVGIVIGVFLAALGVLLNISESWGRRLGFLTGPFTASLLLLAFPWASRAFFVNDNPWGGAIFATESILPKLVANGIVLAIICGVSWTANRFRQRDSGLLPTFKFASAFGVLVIVAITAGIGRDRSGRLPFPAVAQAAQSQTRPNVVLLSLDTVRADHLSLYGYSRETTPHLAALAKEATVYTNVYAVSDMTLATHASMFTGVYPRRHGAHYTASSPFGGQIATSLPTLPEILLRNGYFTAGLASNYAYLDPYFGFGRGFQTYDIRRPVGLFDPHQTYYLRDDLRNVIDKFAPLEQFDRLYRSAGELHQEVFPMLDQLAARKSPFFLFVNYMDAHAPRMPPPYFTSLFPNRNPQLNATKYFSVVQEVMKQERPIREDERASAISLYDDSLAYLDDQLAKLVDRLKALGLYENTLIIITADHGEAFGARGLMEHSVSVYQNQINVPLVIKYPNSHEARKVDQIVSQVDLLPTILSAVGLPPQKDVRGIDLQDQKTLETPRTLISESFPDAVFVAWNRRFNQTQTASIAGHLKLIVFSTGKRELYDLANDPDETRDLYATDAKASGPLAEQLAAWMKSVVPAPNISTRQDTDGLRKLKSLGYAQ